MGDLVSFALLISDHDGFASVGFQIDCTAIAEFAIVRRDLTTIDKRNSETVGYKSPEFFH